MAKPREWLLERGDEVEVNGQKLTVLEVSEVPDDRKTVYLSDDYMLRLGKRSELFKRIRLKPDTEEMRAVPLSSLRVLK